MKLMEASEAQKRERDRLTHAEWGKKLTPDEYALREERLRAHRWSRQTMQTWLLVEDGRVLSSCETFRMTSVNREVRGHSYGVASVFTESALRGKGYAQQMMTRLQDALATQDARVQSSILFSDVGAPLYERSGYQARAGNDRWLKAAAHPPTGAELISERFLADHLASVAPPDEPFLIWPTAEQLDWHLERERIYSETLQRTRPHAVGAKMGRSRAFWCGYYASNVLAVLLLSVTSPEEATVLLREAQRAAAQAGLDRVLLWESAAIGPWQRACDAFPSVPREGYLPMIRPFAEGADASSWNVIPRALWI